MIAMLFEYRLNNDHQDEYKQQSAMLRQLVAEIDGFISIEVYTSVIDPQKLLGLGFFRDEEAVTAWRNLPQHRTAQALGRHHLFTDYRLRMAQVTRDYSMIDREQVPDDSRAIHTTQHT